MREINSETKFTDGQTVFVKSNPGRKVTIRRYYKRIYYCRPAEGGDEEFAFFADEISAVL